MKNDNSIQDLASAPVEYVQEIAIDKIGRRLSDEEIGILYGHIESDINEAIDSVINSGIITLFTAK